MKGVTPSATTNLAFPAPTPRTSADGSRDAMFKRIARRVERGSRTRRGGDRSSNHAWRVLEGGNLHGGDWKRKAGSGSQSGKSKQTKALSATA